MKVLIKKATIHQPGQEDSSKKDILIENGVITSIAKSITDGKATLVESQDLHVSPGWMDIGVQTGQPGYEYRETFSSVSLCARAGGYTALAPFPRTLPPIHSRVEIEYIHQLVASLPVRVYPIGAISYNLEGKDLTEMIDMVQAGAVAFSDGRKNAVEAGLLTRAMEYSLPMDVPIVHFPLDRSLVADGQIHEGKMSASLGLSGIPTVAEDITVQRDIKLVAYTGGRLHFHALSSGTALGYVQKAKSD
jgi:dihydroorotase